MSHQPLLNRVTISDGSEVSKGERVRVVAGSPSEFGNTREHLVGALRSLDSDHMPVRHHHALHHGRQAHRADLVDVLVDRDGDVRLGLRAAEVATSAPASTPTSYEVGRMSARKSTCSSLK